MKRIVIALGGNALGNDVAEQIKNVRKASETVAAMLSDRRSENQIIITHGNGPQVGLIRLMFENSDVYMPLGECCAMSQGYIGYHLQNAINESMDSHALKYVARTLITEVLVDKNDPAFLEPTKPIGTFYSYEEARKIMSENPGIIMKEDSGRGYRRVVASPRPLDIPDKSSILNLLDNGHIVITCGGGGIPVCEVDGRKAGVECIIDKDLTASLLARQINADTLLILTAVDNVYLNYGKPDQKKLGNVSAAEMERYINEGHFASGSMLPKVKAAIEFVSSAPDKKAIITSLENASEAINGTSGTVIMAEAKVPEAVY